MICWADIASYLFWVVWRMLAIEIFFEENKLFIKHFLPRKNQFYKF